MATTCDYCHKPLSLMRRLRGEQFCSVEHLDLYTAQQAEFALQRLAASIEEHPAAPRPAALLKRLSRPATEQVSGGQEPETPVGRADVALEEAPHEAPSAEFLRVARSLEEPKPVAPLLRRLAQEPPEPPSEQPLVIRPVELPDYPMADFVSQNGIAPALLAGRAASIISEPADPAPVSAKPRLAVEPQAEPTPAEPLVLETGSSNLPWSSATPTDPTPLGASELQLPQPDITAADPLLPSAPSLPIDMTALAPAFAGELEPTAVAANPQRPELPGAVEPKFDSTSAPAPASAVPNPVTIEPAAIENVWTEPSTVEFEGPSHLEFLDVDIDALEAAIRPAEIRSVWASTIIVEPGAIAEPEILVSQGSTVPAIHPSEALPVASLVALPFAPRIQWNPKPLLSAQEICDPAGPFEPSIGLGWPVLAAWEPEQPSMASRVPLSDFPARVPTVPRPQGKTSWMTAEGNLRTPRLANAMPHLGSTGPSFGWEQARPKVSAIISAPPPESQARIPMPGIRTSFPAISDTPMLSETRTMGSAWSRPRQSAGTASPSTESNQEHNISLRVRELRARVSAKLEAAQARSNADWAAPRLDASGIEPCLSANERPASVTPDVVVRPLANHSVMGLQTVERRKQRSLTGKTSRPAAITVALAPVRYSPVSLVVTPQPNYRLGSSAITEEGRFVAQSPKSGSVPVRLRQIGYRMPGPYPKVPRCMPDSYLGRPDVQVPVPSPDPILDWSASRRDASTLPRLEATAPARVHPADYFKWPSLRSPRADRVLLMKDIHRLLGNVSDATVPVRRFGPARAGLQPVWPEADGISRTGA